MSYKYYQFDDPVFALVIATGADTAVLEYQENVADIQDGVSYYEINSERCLEKLASTSTEDMPTIEIGYKHSAIKIQDSLFEMANNGNSAVVLTVAQTVF